MTSPQGGVVNMSNKVGSESTHTIVNDKKFGRHAAIPQALEPIHDALG